MNLHSKRHLATMRLFRAILSAHGETRPANRTTIRMKSSANEFDPRRPTGGYRFISNGWEASQLPVVV